MKLKHVFMTLGLAAVLGLGVGAGLKAGQVKEAKADTDRTVYCAIYGTKLGDLTLKVNANIGDNNTWRQSDMVNTGKTYENRMIFRGTISEKYGGVDALQFQLYDGSTWKEEIQPYSSWTAYSVFEGKMFIYDTSAKVDYAETTVHFVDKDGTVGDELEYNAANNQYEGVYTTSADNEHMKLKKVTGATTTYPVALDGSLSSDIATSDGSWVTIKAASAYMIYYKADTKIWVTSASNSLVAYAYAGYFLTHIGCDPNGQNVPSGWSTLSTKYEGLADGVKNYIYSFDVSKAEDGDDIADMIERYEWAINHNPNSLVHFIKNSSGTERAIAPSRINITPVANNADSTLTIAIVAVSAISLLAVGGFFFIRKRKESK